MSVRIKEHKSYLINGHPEKSAASKHSWNMDHVLDWKGARVIKRTDNWRKRNLLEEMSIIKCGKTAMNERSAPVLHHTWTGFMKKL